jgi:glutamyl-tRNA synthetase
LNIVVDDDAKLAAVAKAQQERAKTPKEMAENSTFFFRDVTAYDEKAAKKNLTADAAPLLRQARDRMAALESWTAPQLHEVIQAVAAEAGAGMGKVAQPIRVAVSGGSVSPPIDATLEILGRETTLQRLDRAIAACG